MEIAEGGLDEPDVQTLLAEHHAFGRSHTPAENAHVLDLGRLRDPAITFWTAREGGALLGMVALKELDSTHGEVKSMRTATAALRRGVARALLGYLIAAARGRGYVRLRLETGTHPAFDAANRLYEAAGFVDGPVFGGYPVSAHNRFMTMAL
jgi:putative acetyltransferase